MRLDFIIKLWYNKNMRHRLVAFVFYRPVGAIFYLFNQRIFYDTNIANSTWFDRRKR